MFVLWYLQIVLTLIIGIVVVGYDLNYKQDQEYNYQGHNYAAAPSHNYGENQGAPPQFDKDKADEERLASLRNKWAVDKVLRDLDHIKHDMKEMVDLKDAGKLAPNQVLFFMIRMHDFDDNGGLDGIEFRAAFTHSLHDQPDDENKFQRIEEMIEGLMTVDDNFDGVVSYAELVSHLKKEQDEAKKKKQQEQN